MRVVIDTRSSGAYSSYYIKAIQCVFGRSNVLYRHKPFISLSDIGSDMRFVIESGGEKRTKVFLHLSDSYKLSDADYEWCDIYGCVNANYSHYPQSRYPKLISLVPSFGVRVEGSAINVFYQSFVRLCPIWHEVIMRKEWNKYAQKEECNPFQNIKHYFTRNYRAWKNRLPIEAYQNSIPSEDNYIFFLSTLWQSDEWNKNDEGVNLRRARFIRACKSIENQQFEGGLLGDDSSSNDLFADVLTMKRIPFTEWIEKTKRSALVFNTPAFWNCHGWKLGEYLALGKCIISTKLSNDLPYPLAHGVNIHFVEETEEAMREAIEYILSHPEYRHKLEHGAREYWEKYGSPEASLRLLGIIP